MPAPPCVYVSGRRERKMICPSVPRTQGDSRLCTRLLDSCPYYAILSSARFSVKTKICFQHKKRSPPRDLGALLGRALQQLILWDLKNPGLNARIPCVYVYFCLFVWIVSRLFADSEEEASFLASDQKGTQEICYVILSLKYDEIMKGF